MQEFWVTVSRHHSSLRFKLNVKSHTVNVDNFRDMLKICHKLPGQIFEEPPHEEEILSFIRDLGHIDYFMEKDQAIPRRNKMFWHFARDDFMFTTIRVISKHQDTQVYGVILRQHLTNQAMLESESYNTYLAFATGEKILKPKYVKNKADSESSPKKKTATTTKGKRLKTSAMAAKPAKKKQPAKTSKAKDEGTSSKPGVPDVPIYGSDDEQISWKSSDEEDDDEVGLNDDDDDGNDDDEDNDDYDDDADNQDDDDQEDDGQDDEDQNDVNEHNEEESDEEIQDANVEEEELDEDEVNELYRDVNVNLEGQEIEMTDAQQTNVQTTQVIEDTHVIITSVNPEGQQQSSSVSSGFVSNMLNPSPDIGIDSIFNLNTESTSLIDILVTTIAEPPLLSTTTLPPPPTPLITHLQQTPVPTPATVPRPLLHNKTQDKQALKRQDKEVKDEEPSTGSNRGCKRRRAGKEPESTSAPKEKTSKTIGKSTEGFKSHHKSADESAQAEEPMQTAKDLEEPAHQEFKTGVTEDQPDEETSQLPDWFQKLAKPPTPDYDWNKTLPNAHGPIHLG
ncbi:hypothetical protein Tco_0532194 [Tanacetum coccineum]